jgi:gliding motility associated protien GldN
MKAWIYILMVGLLFATEGWAQPQKRKVTTKKATTTATTTAATVDRASLLFPTQMEMPEDAVWRRDIYRLLDLKKDKNAALYYPVEPVGTRVNLFTYLFQLLLDRKIQAYEYRLDGNESFAEADKLKVKVLLEKYNIYYETVGGKYTVENSDIPSAEVLRYYIKESSYYDQHTATYQAKVTAICPVMLRSDDFGSDGTPYPMFWLKYDEISPYLAKLPVMSSNLNNAGNMSADDYFTMNAYDGTIYKTNNMQGKILAQTHPSDSDLVKEQKHIESELVGFESNLWKLPETKKEEAAQDSLAATTDKTVKKTRTASSVRRGRSSSKSEANAAAKSPSKSSTSKASSSKTKSSKSSGATSRVSARRQRR